MLSIIAKAQQHVVRVRDQVVALALPDENHYLQLQQRSQLIIAGHAHQVAPLLAVELDVEEAPVPDADETMTLAAHDRVTAVKRSLNGPLDARAVCCAWLQASTVLPMVMLLLIALALILWLMTTPSTGDA